MNRIEVMEEQLVDGTISEVDLEILYQYYDEEGSRLWYQYIYEKDPKRKKVLWKKVEWFDKRDTDFLKVYIDFLIYQIENRTGEVKTESRCTIPEEVY